MKRILVLFSLSGLLLTGCYPGDYGENDLSDYDLVITNYDKDFNFGTVQTYAMPDSIVKIGSIDLGDDNITGPDVVDPVYADQILATVRNQMNARGWTEVDETANPDVILLTSTMTTENVYYYYDPYYWGWYYPYYGYGWYYPGYYPSTSYTSFTSGSFLMQMSYPDGININDQIPILWTAVVNGVAEGTNAEIVGRVNKAIGTAFDQSPYLTK